MFLVGSILLSGRVTLVPHCLNYLGGVNHEREMAFDDEVEGLGTVGELKYDLAVWHQVMVQHETEDLVAATPGTPASKTTGPKLDSATNVKVNALLKASREETQMKKSERAKKGTLKGQAPKDQAPPGPGLEEKKTTEDPKVEPTISGDPAPLTENENPAGDPTPREKEEGKATHLREKGGQQWFEEGVKEERIRVKSQWLRDKCRKEKEKKEERPQVTAKGKQAPPLEASLPKPKQEEEMEEEEGHQGPKQAGRKWQRQRKKDFYIRKKLITSQAEQQDEDCIIVNSDSKDDLENTWGTLEMPDLDIQTALQELHLQLAMMMATRVPADKAQWAGIPKVEAKILLKAAEEAKEQGRKNRQAAQHPQ
ncbi:hypothetical protein NDU88_000904 [Pleurodeles waltl]|uniref:Uncharacterized protein n=1 Tax=Pleurodeles waltl TaxID=8319 RepID=A0AAV7MJE6_PLEWA|nr:hypothetical protein NDU88_000904 [Pleurodeles waltl]